MKNLNKENWITSNERYGGKTTKRKDDNGNWEYKTEIWNNNELTSFINEYYVLMNNQNQCKTKYWTKRTTFINNKITFEIFFIKDNELHKNVKDYTNIELLTNDIKTIFDSTVQQSNLKKRSSQKYYYSLENCTITTINNINKFIDNITLLNENLIKFKEQPNNTDFNILLNVYKYLTIMQKIIDKPQTIDQQKIGFKIKKKIHDFIQGILLIGIAFTGKNAQRIISTYAFDEQDYSTESYFHGIFLNYQNYLMTLIDTTLITFFISAVANWSRDIICDLMQNVICHKTKSKNDNFTTKQIPTSPFTKYKDEIEALLYEENNQKLKANMPQMKVIDNLIKKINAVENSPTFNYHPQFIKEVENINELQRAKNNNQHIDDVQVNKVLLSINKVIDNLTKLKKSILEPLTWKQRINYSLADLSLELTTWAMAHTIMSGAIANATQEIFTISEWTNYIFKPGIILGNLVSYLTIRPINSIFKWGLQTLNIPTNICPQKISNWVEKQGKCTKFSMAIFLFFFVAIFTNIIKTESSLVTKYGFIPSFEWLSVKLEKKETWLFFILTTASQMFAFSISSFYKIFNFDTLIKKIKYFGKPDISLLEEKLIELNNNNLSIFTNEEIMKTKDILLELNIAHKKCQNFQVNQSTLNSYLISEKFNANLINNIDISKKQATKINSASLCLH